MNFDENITEVFDRYLTGQMTEVEEREFLEQLQNDPSLKQAYESHRTIVAGIREARREELKDYIKQNAKIRYMGNVWSPKWVMTSAAVLVIFFSAYIVVEFILKPTKTKEIVNVTEEQADSSQPVPADVPVTEENENIAELNTPEKEQVIKKEGDNAETEHSDEAPASYKDFKDFDMERAAVTTDKKRSVPLIAVNLQKAENKANNSSTATIDVYYKEGEEHQYRYNDKQLILYKVSYDDRIAVYNTNVEDYLAWKKKYYELKADGKAHPLQELTDLDIIKQLPALK